MTDSYNFNTYLPRFFKNWLTLVLFVLERVWLSVGRFKRRCSVPMCPNLTYTAFCDEHKENSKVYAKTAGIERKSANSRGYNYQWQKARKEFLNLHPLCVSCQREGRIVPANVVDHITPHKGNKQLFWDVNNWQALCTRCHNRKTASEDMGAW